MKIIGSIFISTLLAGAMACAGGQGKGEVAEPDTMMADMEKSAEEAAEETAEAATETATETAEEAAEREERMQRIAGFMKRVKEAADTENARWTPAMHDEAKALVAKDYRSSDAAMKAILAGSHRVPANTERDKYRHPAETLSFFGVRQDMTVIEVGAGAGWYTEILAPYLAKNGQLMVAGPNPEGPEDSFMPVVGYRFQRFMEKAPELYGKIKVVYVEPPESLDLGTEVADVAIAVREMHGWQGNGYLKEYVAAIYKSLKPGGVFGIVQHRAKPGEAPEVSSERGRLDEAWVIETVESVGFKLVDKAEINANPKDTKDYERGVWVLPPGYALGDQDRDKYQAIGESDRMTLKFAK